MEIESTKIRDVYIVTPESHDDARGYVMETFRADIFEETVGGSKPLLQLHDVFSQGRNTVRGLNFQWDPPMGKLVRVVSGEVFLVAVDIRIGSPTFGQWVGIIATGENRKELYAPAGFARGMQTLTDNTLVQYCCTAVHDGAAQEMAILWDDPEIGIDWPIKEPPKHTKDAPTLAEWTKRSESEVFTY